MSVAVDESCPAVEFYAPGPMHHYCILGKKRALRDVVGNGPAAFGKKLLRQWSAKDMKILDPGAVAASRLQGMH